MSKKFQLTIPEPCHEDWSKMQPEEKGRFCGSCQKGVMDFTDMSNQQLIVFFKKPSTGSVCGRFNHDQLNHDFEIPRKRIPWLKYFFTIAVPAFLASNKATAQGNVRIRKEISDSTCDRIIMGKPAPSVIVGELKQIPIIIEQPDSMKISGRIVDEENLPIAFATVMIKGTKIVAISDVNGFFNIKAPDSNNTLVASSVGYETVEKKVNEMSNTNVILFKMAFQVMGQMIITKCYPKPKPIPLIQRIFKDTAFKNFKFYPNPAVPGSTITIQWKKQEAGEFEIQLLNQEGQTINRKTENFVEKTNAIQYNIPSVAAGNYFLIMINRKTQKRITEKIIIQ